MSESENLPDPATLDPEALNPETYHAVVGPALQAAAEVAAQRGDPSLAADMPAMLALIEVVQTLAIHWQAAFGADENMRDTLENAPVAACVVVLQEAGLDDDAVGQCVEALEAAHARLVEASVTAVAARPIEAGWRALQADRRADALEQFKAAVGQIVAAVDNWQAKVH